MIKGKGRIEITIICIIIGIMLVLQVRSIDELGGMVNMQRANDLAAELNQVKNDNKTLMNRLNELEALIENFENEASKNNVAINNLKQNLDNAKLVAGLTDVFGTGIIISLDYESIENDNFDPFLYNYELLLILINELNASGAEAISINDERIINSTEIRLAGNSININRKRFTRPFIIKVIGDQQTLKSAILMRSGIIDIMKANYINVSIKDVDELTIEKYNGVIDFKYATKVE